jgi:hypothetical protein
MQCVSYMRFKSPKKSGTRASFERAGVITHTVSTRNEQVHEFKGVLDRNRKALHNLGLTWARIRPTDFDENLSGSLSILISNLTVFEGHAIKPGYNTFLLATTSLTKIVYSVDIRLKTISPQRPINAAKDRPSI